ncbi:HpcH/HpaI aldolase family protein [Pararhizobium mangrovi]|uniref:4-hydroxy-2-oxovalerate aldolase n=1 Tax=Pararhizobium mangrovi TaxID=2590452 RepID=A0A506UA12_9HYPH|nr:aldolase/citrate lyase family protein [Pararhizobium mangrovi]TPW30196.1 4-hydroxy-2-oxovalerate aldolase [Pararhizobium mangrovi]
MANFRERIRGGEPFGGSFAAIPHPVAVEVLANAGLDVLCIDWEHAQIGRERIEDLLRAAGTTPTLVRVPGHGAEAIAASLDAGAAGVLVPRVETAEDAHHAVAATRYPPLGARGAGPGRAAGYGYDIAAYIERANRSLALAVQVETRRGVENVEAIAAVEEVDLVFVGPGDLAVSLGVTPDDPAPLEAAIARVIEVCRAAGKSVGIFRPDTSDVERWREAGVSFFLFASDTMLLGAGASETAARFKATKE